MTRISARLCLMVLGLFLSQVVSTAIPVPAIARPAFEPATRPVAVAPTTAVASGRAATAPRTSAHPSAVPAAALPLSFEPNLGQMDAAAQFRVRAPGADVFFTAQGLTLAIAAPAATHSAGSPRNPTASHDPGPATVVQVHYVGASATAQLQPGAALPGKVNYFLGADPSQWRTNVPTYGGVEYTGLYPGINLAYGPGPSGLKSTYTVAPQADPSQIHWSYQGASQVSVDTQGQLLVRGATGPTLITEQAPLVWQERNGQRITIPAHYTVAPDGSVGFALASYDHAQPLVIDPSLQYGTYLGGTGTDEAFAIALDSTSNVYLTGHTNSTNFPLVNPAQSTITGTDAFVAKFDPTLHTLIYSTYYGGSSEENGRGIAVDGSGNAYVTGDTTSTDLPTTANAYQATVPIGGSRHVFVLKLNAAGSAIAYSTYLGGTGTGETGYAIALDGVGAFYVGGSTVAPNFPILNAYQSTIGGGQDGFITKFNANYSLGYSTYLGGTAYDAVYGLAVNIAGNAYVTGYTNSTGFPTTSGAAQTTLGGSDDVFIAELSTSGGSLVYSTLLGGATGEQGRAIALDPAGAAYVTGYTNGTSTPGFPTTAGAFQTTAQGSYDAFVTKVNPTGTAFAYSTILGGSGGDYGNAIAVDASGTATVTGQATGGNPTFPMVQAFQTYAAQFYDAFVTRVTADGSGLVFSTFLTTAGNQIGYGVALDSQGNAYEAGNSYQAPTFTIGSPEQASIAGYIDAVVVKIAAPNLGSGGPASKESGSPSEKDCGCVKGDPIELSSGNFSHTFSDIAIPGRGAPLAFSHTYNALNATKYGTAPMGWGWTHSYNLWVDHDSTTYYVHEGNGSVTPFPLAGPGYLRVLARFSANVNGTYTYTHTNGWDVDSFRTDGKLGQIRDRNGYVTTLTYDSFGTLTTVTDSAGRTLTFGYTSGLLTSVTDPAGHSITFAYNGSNDMTSFTDRESHQTSFTYTGHHYLATMTDPRGGVVTNTYDTNARVTQQTDALNRTTQIGYAFPDSIHSQATVTNSLGYTTVYTFDSNRLTDIVRNPGGALQATEHLTYAANYPTGVASVTDANGHTAMTTWDTNGNQLSVTDPLSRTTQFAYNATNRVTVITATNGLTTTFGYDAGGNVLAVTRPVTETNSTVVSTLGYDPMHPGDVLTATNPLGHSQTFGYDTYGNQVSSTNPLGETNTATYDTLGRATSTSSPLIHTTRAVYNLYNEPTLITDTLGFTQTRSYDANGNLSQVIDAKGHVTSYTYDLDNAVTQVTQPDATTIRTGYDVGGQVISQTNALTQTMRYAYNSLGQLIQTTDPLTRTQSFGYDLIGNQTILTDALGLVTTAAYDAANQRIGVTYNSTSTPDVSYGYNTLGARTVMTDGTGTTTYSYDSLERTTSVRNGAGSTVGYAYDAANRLTTLTYPNGRTVTQGYNDANRLTSVTPWSGYTSSFTYNAEGMPTKVQYDYFVTMTVGLNNAAQITAITDTTSSGVLFAQQYTRDATGLLATTNETGQGTDTYSYDPLSRLITDKLSATASMTRTWGYDGATEVTQTTIQPGTGFTTTSTRTYDAADQFRGLSDLQNGTATRLLAFTYNANGARTQQLDRLTSTTTNYTYDQAGRLKTYNGTWTYAYNGDGQRMSKTASGTTTNFTWAGGLLLQDSTQAYIYGPTGLLAQVALSTMSTNFYYPDQLGNIRLVTDAHSGAVVATKAYDAYGTVLTTTGTLTTAFGYTGEYTDAESGLVYLRARYYDPSTQQFLTVDSLLAVTGQAYAYVAGSPTNATDPSGMAASLGNDGGNTAWAAAYEGELEQAAGNKAVGEFLAGAWKTLNFHCTYCVGEPVGGNPFAVFGFDNHGRVDAVSVALAMCPPGAGVVAEEVDSFKALDARSLRFDGLELHHVPQNALHFLPRPEGGAIALPKALHALTRTWGWKGTATAIQDAGLPFSVVLDKDIQDLRSLGVSETALGNIMDFYKTNHPELFNK